VATDGRRLYSGRVLHAYYEDPNLIVLEKPAGLLSQGEITGDENLVDLLRVRFGRNYVGLVHRLDRNTSGIMVVAKRSKAATRLSESLQKGELRREYVAWVHGEIARPLRWEHWLVKDEKTNTVRAYAKPHGDGKPSALTLKPVARGRWHGEPLTLIELALETGRSHQIRAQAAAEGHPLLGDEKYLGGKFPSSREFGRPALHSRRIAFPHPIGGAALAFVSPLPPEMAAIRRDAR